MLSYRAFKHTNASAIKEAFSYTKLQHLILFAYWLVLEPKGTGRAAEFIHLVKLVHLFNFFALLKFKACKVLRKENANWLSSMWVLVLTIGLPFITGLTEVEESRKKDLDFKEKN